MSADSVFFYVNANTLLSCSNNEFGGTLSSCKFQKQPNTPPKEDEDPFVASVPEPSDVLNVVLHTLYDLPCSHYSPSFATLSSSVTALRKYGVSVKTAVSPKSLLHAMLLSHAPTNALELYTIAAENELHDLAISTSPHLLSLSLSELTDEIAQRMGPIYLKKLFFLHLGRVDALKRLMLSPPPNHAPTPDCGFAGQGKVTRAWALAAAYLGWDARPDIAASTIEATLRPLVGDLECNPCREALNAHIKSLVVNWSVVKRTI